MKKIIVLFALIVILITTVGCSNSSPSNEVDAAETPATENGNVLVK